MLWLPRNLRNTASEMSNGDAEYGSLSEVFPDEAEKWAKLFRVDAADCVAFRLDGEKQRAEVVLQKKGDTFRLLRCNNVKQL